MKKRYLAITAVIAAVLIAFGAVHAGSKGCHQEGEGYGYSHHHHGKKGKYRMKHMVRHLGKELDLTDEQTESLKEIYRERRENLHSRKGGYRMMMLDVLALDPGTEDYDDQVARMADRVADMAHEHVLFMADDLRKAADVLTPEQLTRMREVMTEKMSRRLRHHEHEEES